MMRRWHVRELGHSASGVGLGRGRRNMGEDVRKNQSAPGDESSISAVADDCLRSADPVDWANSAIIDENQFVSRLRPTFSFLRLGLGHLRLCFT
jgi:hypothetical protein